MRTWYGPNGFVSKAEYDLGEALRLAAVKYCDKHKLNYTLGTMLEMSKFAAECVDEYGKDWEPGE